MPASGTTFNPSSGLRRECLSLSEVVAQSVANIAPSATPALIAPLVFADAGNGTWLAYVIATIALLLVTYHINCFARRSASPGALYTFVAHGLGATWGVICGWCLIIAYLLTGSATLAGAANYATVLAGTASGTRGDLIVAALAVLAAALGTGAIAYKDIRLSTRAMLLLEFVSIALILTLAAVFLLRHRQMLDASQLTLSGGSGEGVRRGLVLAVFSFVGFESATALGHEARDPLRSIPRSVLLTVVAVGAFFTFMSYILVMAFHGQPVAFNESNAPLSVLASLDHLSFFGPLIALGAIISFFACALASLNAGARVLFAMARHGLVHSSAARAHDTHATPHIAVAISALFMLLVPFAMLTQRMAPMEIFGYLGSVATFGFLASYVLVSLAAPRFMRRIAGFGAVPVLMALLALAALSFPIAGSVYPPPAGAARFLPFVFLALLLPGTLWFAYLRARHPEIIDEIEAALEQ